TMPQGELRGREFGDLLVRVDLFRSSMLQFLRDYDLILCPAAALPDLPHDSGWTYGDRLPAAYAQPFNHTGWPAAVVRVGTTSRGLPIDVQVVGRPWREDAVLAAAASLEDLFGGWKMPPNYAF